MKDKIYLVIAIILTSLCTYYFASKNKATVVESKIVTVHDTVKIKSIVGKPIIKTETVFVPRYNIIHDTVIVMDSTAINITTANLDTAVQFLNRINLSDTVLSTYDTLNLKVKYYFPPVNRFEITPTLITSHFVHYAKNKSQTTILDNLTLGIGVGYAGHLDNLQIKPAIFFGIIYKIKLF